MSKWNYDEIIIHQSLDFNHIQEVYKIIWNE